MQNDFLEQRSPVKSRSLKRKNLLRNSIFYVVMAGIPILQVIIFYIYVNFNSILLAFKTYDEVTMSYKWLSGGAFFSNFQEFFHNLTTLPFLKAAFGNTFMMFGLVLLVSYSGGILLSNYIYKKRLFGKFFRVILFTPSMISGIIMVTLFQFFADAAVPVLTGNATVGLLADPNTAFPSIICYTLWLGLGSGMLVYVGTMGSINDSMVEAAQLDGCTPMQEFFTITLPTIYPTILTFFVARMAGIFGEQINLFTFYGADAPYDYYTYGYWLYVRTLAGEANYPLLAAAGLCFTLVLAPCTLLVRWLLNKFGPSAD